MDKNLKDKAIEIPYIKANKLITALFMVTDIMDKEEPMKAKLRALGMDIISDIHTTPSQAQAKINQILSFLDIASTVRMISEMNASILKKEFSNLYKSIDEATLQGGSTWLENFMLPPKPQVSDMMEITEMNPVTNPYQGQHMNLGVQNPTTLMKALSDAKMPARPISNSNKIPSHFSHVNRQPVQKDNKDNFDVLKKQRRDEIVKVIKEDREAQARGGSTITDIRNGAKKFSNLLNISALLSCSEKTLQRELISMVKDNVLNKTGEKRWSKYFLPARNA